MENPSSVTGWQELLSHTNPSNFWQSLQSLLLIIWLKIYMFLNFDVLFQLLLTKFSKSERFASLQKDDHVTNYCKRAIVVKVTIDELGRGWTQFVGQHRGLRSSLRAVPLK